MLWYHPRGIDYVMHTEKKIYGLTVVATKKIYVLQKAVDESLLKNQHTRSTPSRNRELTPYHQQSSHAPSVSPPRPSFSGRGNTSR